MSDVEKQRLFEELEERVRSAARLAAVKSGLVRWAADVEQDVLVLLWRRLCEYDSDKRNDLKEFVESRIQYSIRDSLKKYRRWDSREVQFPDHFEL